MPSAIQAWRDQVEAHHAQTHRAMAGRPEGDLWTSMAGRFKDDPHREEDPVVASLEQWVGPDGTVLDVGGGAGRLALPLALRCRHVTVVEPSPSMLGALRESAASAGIENVSVVEKNFEDTEVEPHDVVLCAHVVYGLTDIETFVRKLAASARERVVIIAWMRSPLSRMSPLWEEVHQEPRIELPGMTALLPALWEMEIYPDITMLPPVPVRGMPNREAAIATARAFMYVEPGSEKDQRLLEAAERLMVETESGILMKDTPRTPQAILHWRTDRDW